MSQEHQDPTQPAPSKKMDIIQRLQKYGEHQSDLANFVDSETSELKDLVQREYFIPRKVDVQRMASIVAQLDGPQRIVDLGGGKGLLDKLLADELGAQAIRVRVVDIDNDKRIIEQAKSHYASPNLDFEVANITNTGAEAFSKPTDVVIASWVVSMEYGGPDIRPAVEKLMPKVFIAVGDEGREFTEPVNPGEGYVKLCEWLGPASQEVATGHPLHIHLGEEATVFEKGGSNLFEVYVRRDAAESGLDFKGALEGLNESGGYNWERELTEHYPAPSSVRFTSSE